MCAASILDVDVNEVGRNSALEIYEVVVCGDIDRIDPETRQVSVVERSSTGDSSRNIEADYLVVSLGAELVPDAIPGLAQAGHSFYTLAGAESLRDALRSFDGGRIVVLTAAPAYKCPAAPYEAAMLVSTKHSP